MTVEPPKAANTKKSMLAILPLRGVALGGRFLFAIFAAKYMLPADFGRYGLLAALAIIVPSIVGLEAYQVLLRRILQEPNRAEETRRFYGVFMLAASLMSGGIGALTLAAFGWSAAEIWIGAAILTVEYIGLETTRNLINEHRPALSVLSIALRTGVWGVAIPGLYYVGLMPTPWEFQTVLWFWFAGTIAAITVGSPLWCLFRPRRRDLNLLRNLSLLKDVLDRSWTWVIYNASWKIIETGGRFICAWMLTEAAVGRFTLLSMLGSLSYVAQKSVVEPVYYPRLSLSDAGERTHRQFRRLTIAAIIGGTGCSGLGMVANAWLTASVPPKSELISFGLLCLAFAFLSLSQPAHFQLYREHKDKTIMATAVIACVVMVVSSALATWLWGMMGTAGGTMLGALVGFTLKSRAARALPVRYDTSGE